jgi:cytochrome c biogenesis protein ResB
MAKDYYNYGQLNDFTSKIINANKAKKKDEEDLYINGITGYEQYYLDIQGFWR